MNAKELAAKLNGRLIGLETARVEDKEAKAAGLVVVFGASDDLMEFRGAIDDETGAYQGTEVTVDAEGLLSDFDDLDKDDKDEMREYFRREGKGRTIRALWCEEEPYSWTFKTDIPHETFEIVEDGEPWCRGIVFALKDAAA